MTAPVANHVSNRQVPTRVSSVCGQPKDGTGPCQAPWQYIVQFSDRNESRAVCCGKHLTTLIDRLIDQSEDNWGYVRVRTKLVDIS